MGYGKPDYSKKWWLDLADLKGDGVLQVPEKISKKTRVVKVKTRKSFCPLDRIIVL